MSDPPRDVVLLERRIEAAELRRLVLRFEQSSFALVGEGEAL